MLLLKAKNAMALGPWAARQLVVPQNQVEAEHCMFDQLLKMIADPNSVASQQFRLIHSNGGFDIVTPLLLCVSQAIDDHNVAPEDLGNSTAAETFLDRQFQQCDRMRTRSKLIDLISQKALSRAGFDAEAEADAYLQLVHAALLTKAAKHFRIDPFQSPMT